MIDRKMEIERNFDEFQRVVNSLMTDHEGKYALMHNGAVSEVFERLLDAVSAGHSRFTDGMFSIQEVATAPLDLGFFSHANPERRVC